MQIWGIMILGRFSSCHNEFLICNFPELLNRAEINPTGNKYRETQNFLIPELFLFAIHS